MIACSWIKWIDKLLYILYFYIILQKQIINEFIPVNLIYNSCSMTLINQLRQVNGEIKMTYNYKNIFYKIVKYY